jgi:hypothetical protein
MKLKNVVYEAVNDVSTCTLMNAHNHGGTAFIMFERHQYHEKEVFSVHQFDYLCGLAKASFCVPAT